LSLVNPVNTSSVSLPRPRARFPRRGNFQIALSNKSAVWLQRMRSDGQAFKPPLLD
jgi:hypothetical protein